MTRSKVLVVEDDAVLRCMAVDVLRSAGLTVLEADSADAASLIMTDAAAEIAAVFSDIEMPGQMNGIALANAIGEHWPKVTVILTSGRFRPGPDLSEDVAFLPKPYDLDHVASLMLRLIEDVNRGVVTPRMGA